MTQDASVLSLPEVQAFWQLWTLSQGSQEHPIQMSCLGTELQKQLIPLHLQKISCFPSPYAIIMWTFRVWFEEENRLSISINSPTPTSDPNWQENTHIATHVAGVLGVFEVRRINRKPIPSGQEAQASFVQILAEWRHADSVTSYTQKSYTAHARILIRLSVLVLELTWGRN